MRPCSGVRWRLLVFIVDLCFTEVEFRGLGIRLAERVLKPVVTWQYLPPHLRTVNVVLLSFDLVRCHAAKDEPCFGCIGRVSFGVFFPPFWGSMDNWTECFFFHGQSLRIDKKHLEVWFQPHPPSIDSDVPHHNRFTQETDNHLP